MTSKLPSILSVRDIRTSVEKMVLTEYAVNVFPASMPSMFSLHSLMKPGSEARLTSTSFNAAVPAGLLISILCRKLMWFCCIGKLTRGEYATLILTIYLNLNLNLNTL